MVHHAGAPFAALTEVYFARFDRIGVAIHRAESALRQHHFQHLDRIFARVEYGQERTESFATFEAAHARRIEL